MTDAPPFEQVVAEHGPTVLRVCRAILGPTDADDAWIDTFVSALRAYPELPPGQQRTRMVGHDRAPPRDRPRREPPGGVRSRPIGFPTAPPPATPSTADDDHAGLRVALDALGAEATRPRSSTGTSPSCPTPEVARLMGISETAARRNAADGIANLRARLRRLDS